MWSPGREEAADSVFSHTVRPLSFSSSILFTFNARSHLGYLPPLLHSPLLPRNFLLSLSLSPLLLFLPPSPRPSRTFSSNILFFFLFRKNEFFLSLFVTSIFFFFFFFFAPSNLFFFVISVFFLLLSFLLTTILYFSSFFLLEYLELPLLFLSFFVHSTSISYILPLRSPPRVYPLPPPPSTTSTRMSHDFSQTLAPSSSLPLRTYNVQLPEDQITRGMGEALYARYAITKPRSHWSTREWMVGREEAWPEKRC